MKLRAITKLTTNDQFRLTKNSETIFTVSETPYIEEVDHGYSEAGNHIIAPHFFVPVAEREEAIRFSAPGSTGKINGRTGHSVQKVWILDEEDRKAAPVEEAPVARDRRTSHKGCSHETTRAARAACRAARARA